MSNRYIGRFAPSPTGPLHMGSLVCALASFLDARHAGGQWLVRIEDLDPAREPAGAADRILFTLARHGLAGDGDVVFQSRRSPAYAAALERLFAQGLLYRCGCTRARLKSLGRHYDGHCLRNPPPDGAAAALRFSLASARALLGTAESCPADRIHGCIQWDSQLCDDFIVQRKDGLVAYNLAVTVDDAAQQVSHVVRGSDLFASTRQQAVLLQILGVDVPSYCHIPLVCGENGCKLSKQNHAPALDDGQATENLQAALTFLGLPLPAELHGATVAELLSWGVAHWPQAGIFSRQIDHSGLSYGLS